MTKMFYRVVSTSAVSLTLGLLAALLVVVVPAPRVAASATFPTSPVSSPSNNPGSALSWNICSAKCNEDHTALQQKQRHDRIYAAIQFTDGAYNDLWSVSLQEVCIEDHIRLKSLLNIPTGSGAFYVAKNSASKCRSDRYHPGKKFGNTVLARGVPFLDNHKIKFQHQTSTTPTYCDPASSECKGFVCRPMSSFVGGFIPCSAHTYSKNDAVAELQSTDYINTAAFFGSSAKKWLAGDFNLEVVRDPFDQNDPGYFPVTAYDAGYWRSDKAATNNPNGLFPAYIYDTYGSGAACVGTDCYDWGPPYTKIDFIWRDKSNHAFDLGSDYTTCEPLDTASDHCMIHLGL